MVTPLRNVTSVLEAVNAPEGETVVKVSYRKPYIKIVERAETTPRASVQQPRRLVLVGTDEPTRFPVTMDPVEMYKAFQRISKEAGLPFDIYSIKVPEPGKPRMDQPALRFNSDIGKVYRRGQPFLSFNPATEPKEKPERVQPREWK